MVYFVYQKDKGVRFFMADRYLSDKQILDIVHYIVPKVMRGDYMPVRVGKMMFFESLEIGEMIAYAYNIGYNRGKKGRSYLGESKKEHWKKCDGTEPNGTKVRYIGEDDDEENSWTYLKKGDTGFVKTNLGCFGIIPDKDDNYKWICQENKKYLWEKQVEE